VQLPALAREREEVVTVAALEHAQLHARTRRRRLRVDLGGPQAETRDRGERPPAEHRAADTGDHDQRMMTDRRELVAVGWS